MALEIVISVILLIAGIAVLVMVHIWVVGRLFRPRYQTGALPLDSSMGRSQGLPAPPMSTEDLSKLPCFDHLDVGRGGTSSNVDCVVCLESFKGGEKCRSMPDCGHYFHAHCIDSWLLKTPVCPICRTTISSPVRHCNVKLDVIVE